MRFRTKEHRHMIDFLFPVVLFFVFALSALTVLLLAARIYQSTTENSYLNYTSRTALSYISEKLHQNDIADGVSVGKFDGCDALIMEQAGDHATYYTYIYDYDGQLKELFVKEGADVTASSGKTILKIRDFSIETVTDNLLRFNCTDAEGITSSTLVSVKN